MTDDIITMAYLCAAIGSADYGLKSGKLFAHQQLDVMTCLTAGFGSVQNSSEDLYRPYRQHGSGRTREMGRTHVTPGMERLYDYISKERGCMMAHLLKEMKYGKGLRIPKEEDEEGGPVKKKKGTKEEKKLEDGEIPGMPRSDLKISSKVWKEQEILRCVNFEDSDSDDEDSDSDSDATSDGSGGDDEPRPVRAAARKANESMKGMDA